jgi:transposase
MIRIDAVWLAVEPLDMRAGTDTALGRVVKVFGAAHPHHAYLFANRRANRLKVLVHDGIGIWLCARRLHQGRFLWASTGLGTTSMAITREQLDALVLGLPWQCLGEAGVIRVV